MPNIDWSKKRTAAEIAAERAQDQQQAQTSAALAKAQEITARKVIEEIVTDLPEEEAMSVAALFPEWAPDQAYPANKVLRYQGGLLRVLQAHTSQADWLPENTPALYAAHYAPGVIPDWTMPAGGHDAPSIGDERRHNGTCWRSLINGNSTEPGSDPRWWEEFTCP